MTSNSTEPNTDQAPDSNVEIHIHSGPLTDTSNTNNNPTNQWTPSPLERPSLDGIETKGIDEYGFEIELMNEQEEDEKKEKSKQKGKEREEGRSKSDSRITIGGGTQPPEHIHYLKKKDVTHVSFFKQFLYLRTYITAIISAMVILIATILNGFILNKYTDTSSNEEGIEDWKERYKVFMYFYILLISPVAEELVFRKILYGFFKKFSKPIGYLVSCFIYAMAHFGFSFYKFYHEFKYFPIYFIIGVILTFTYDYDGFLASSILANILYSLIKTLLDIIH